MNNIKRLKSSVKRITEEEQEFEREKERALRSAFKNLITDVVVEANEEINNIIEKYLNAGGIVDMEKVEFPTTEIKKKLADQLQ